MEIDRRVRAKEFMALLSMKKDAFYDRIKSGDIQQPVRINRKDVFWHESYVKKKVEEKKQKSDNIACS
ncbi:helix-turn-helix transcriptional regulator [Acinetobacter nosocomialis]|uniref:helix-turn-helix transcriptional regulator n=1 Tax=Acinetobacter nosocomialis TaxID=106654 RepID=UPI001B83ECE4|nr:transcriptional regulator [Acinetobacter nosocomialis]MBR7736443.1 transcriptional regulator [Acinetobacter nosocomialis]